METVDLSAGSYQLFVGSGLLLRCALRVTDAGAWAFDSACDGFLAGRGSDTLRLRGYEVTIDATPLSTPLVFLNLFSLRPGGPFRGPRQVRLLPTTNDYHFQPGPGVVAECAFGVGLDGLVAYPDRFEGRLSGRGTRTVTFHGFPSTSTRAGCRGRRSPSSRPSRSSISRPASSSATGCCRR